MKNVLSPSAHDSPRSQAKPRARYSDAWSVMKRHLFSTPATEERYTFRKPF